MNESKSIKMIRSNNFNMSIPRLNLKTLKKMQNNSKITISRNCSDIMTIQVNDVDGNVCNNLNMNSYKRENATINYNNYTKEKKRINTFKNRKDLLSDFEEMLRETSASI
jgi:hypothetical protein